MKRVCRALLGLALVWAGLWSVAAQAQSDRPLQIVVSVGGTSSITGPLLAALLLGIADVAGKYFIPKMGAFTVYLLMIVILMWRPQGLFTRKGGR